MFHHCIYAFIIFASLTDSTEIVPAFRDSILAGNASAAVEMISGEAILDVDSVLAQNPDQIFNILSYFGLQIQIQEMEKMDGRQLLLEILSSPNFSGAIVLFGISPGEPVQSEEGIFVPVAYGLFGERDTIYLEIVSEGGQWKINDFFETVP
jgi:hypothetical protein